RPRRLRIAAELRHRPANASLERGTHPRGGAAVALEVPEGDASEILGGGFLRLASGHGAPLYDNPAIAATARRTGRDDPSARLGPERAHGARQRLLDLADLTGRDVALEHVEALARDVLGPRLEVGVEAVRHDLEKPREASHAGRCPRRTPTLEIEAAQQHR